MAIQYSRGPRQLQKIEKPRQNIPIEQIIQTRGFNPLAVGIEQAGQVLGQALQKRALMQEKLNEEKKREALALKQRQAMAQFAQLPQGSFDDMPTEYASTLGATYTKHAIEQEAADKKKAEALKKIAIIEKQAGAEPGSFGDDLDLAKTFYTQGQISNRQKERPLIPKGMQMVGTTETGEPIIFDPNTGQLTSGGKAFTGNALPKTVGTEEQRRQALVGGAQKSIADIRQIIQSQPGVLNELKGIQLSPGKVYGQLASHEAKALYINLREAIANEIYLKTGATANEQELENATVSYMAALNDNPNDFLMRMGLLERNITPFNMRRNSGASALRPIPKNNDPLGIR